jgi:hypothetical protein
MDARVKPAHNTEFVASRGSVPACLTSERNLVVHVVALAAGAGHCRLALA